MNENQSSLLDSLFELNHEFSSLLALSYRFKVKMSETSIGLLKALADQHSIHLTQSQIAQRLSVSESTLCTLIEKLRREGLVIRERLITDRRKTKLSLTDQGSQIVTKINEAESQLDSRLAEHIPNGVSKDSICIALQELSKAMKNCQVQTETIRRAA